MATAELAAVLPALVAVLLAAVWVLTAVSAQERCVDAARVGARAAARGESDAVVRRWAGALAPPGARVTVVRGTGTVRVEVWAALRPAGAVADMLPALTLHASVTGPAELGLAAAHPHGTGSAGADDG
jgi:Flp pilus assembly protein TadG